MSWNVAETDFRGGRQEWRRVPEHRGDLPASSQAERESASQEGQADVPGKTRKSYF